MSLDLSQLADAGPELVETIGGMEFRFSELPAGAVARLQHWIRTNTPHPVEAVKPHLDGLTEDERWRLLEAARDEARFWPPAIGSEAGAMALMGGEPGQVEVFREGLSVHHGDVSTEEAFRVFRTLKREISRDSRKGSWTAERAQQRLKRIFGVLFGNSDDDDADGLPKDAGEAAASPGKPSSAGANGNYACASGSGPATPSRS